MWTLVAEASHFTRRNQMKHHNIPYKDGVAGSSPVPPTLLVKIDNLHQKEQHGNATGMCTIPYKDVHGDRSKLS